MKKLIYFISITLGLLFASQAQAAIFFVDVTAAGGGTGLATTSSYNNYSLCVSVARVAGDTCIVRGGTATTSITEDLSWLSDGNLVNPLTIQKDMQNYWSDFATSTGYTATPVQGSVTITLSADQSDIVVGEWIYVEGDCFETYNAIYPSTCEYSYEVSAVSSTTLTLFMPYLGGQTASGLALRIMPANPIWGTTALDFQLNFSGDNYANAWGLDIRGTDSTCTLLTSNGALNNGRYKNMIVQHDGTSSCGYFSDSKAVLVENSRFFGGNGIMASSGYNVKNAYVNCNNVASSFAISALGNSGRSSVLANLIVVNCANTVGATSIGGGQGGGDSRIRNLKHSNVLFNFPAGTPVRIFMEDEFGLVGSSRVLVHNATSATLATTTSATTTSLNGAAKNILVQPPSGVSTTGLSATNTPISCLQLLGFEDNYRIYSDGTSKTYSLSMISTTTGHWTANPTKEELWLEAEYYVDSSDADRVVKKSTNTLNFTGSTAYQSLTVTVDPARVGDIIFRAYYCKPLESGKSNWFIVDPKITF